MSNIWGAVVAAAMAMLAWVFNLMGKKQELERKLDAKKTELEIADADRTLVKVSEKGIAATDNYYKLRDDYLRNRGDGPPADPQSEPGSYDPGGD